MAKATYDWEWVERHYRAGQLSNREICKRYENVYGASLTEAAVRYQAKRRGWEKDLSEKVADRVANKVLRNGLRTEGQEESIIEEAAERGAGIVGSHLEHAESLKARTVELLEDLRNGYITQGEGKKVSLDVDGRCRILQTATNCLNTIVNIERKAYNLDNKGHGEKKQGIVFDADFGGDDD